MTKIKEKSSFYPHFISLCAMVCLGQAQLLVFAGKPILSFFIAFLVYLTASLILFLLSGIFVKKTPPKSAAVFWLACAVYSLFVFKDTFIVFLKFAETVVLKNEISLVLLFAVSLLSLLMLKKEGFLKLSLVFFVLSVVIVFNLVILLFGKYDFKEIKHLFTGSQNLIQNVWLFSKEAFLPLLILIPYQVTIFKRLRPKVYFIGGITGAVILICIYLVPILVFGSGFSSRLAFPFSDAVSTISVGRLYSRLDGFYYFFVFSSTLIKSMTALFTAGMSICNIKKLYEQNSE